MNQLKSLGIIMDGNRRWARGEGLSISEGHRRGFAKVKEVLEWANQAGVKTVFLYAFSTENWHRGKIEIAALMSLFRKFLRTEVTTLFKRGTRLVFIGQLSRFPANLRQKIQAAMETTKNCPNGTLALALSYGGRAEILAAIKRAAADAVSSLRDLTEEKFSRYLWTADLPDPDLIIRTGGEQRLSNFLPWQSVYSELYFTKTYWPAFSRAEFEMIIADYRGRQRSFGR